MNKATSIVAEIEPWEDFTTEMHFEGDNYIGLSSRSVTLGYPAGKTDTVDVQATVPYAIQWLDASGSLVGTAVSGVGRFAAGEQRFYGLDRAELRRCGNGHAIGFLLRQEITARQMRRDGQAAG